MLRANKQQPSKGGGQRRPPSSPLRTSLRDDSASQMMAAHQRPAAATAPMAHDTEAQSALGNVDSFAPSYPAAGHGEHVAGNLQMLSSGRPEQTGTTSPSTAHLSSIGGNPGVETLSCAVLNPKLSAGPQPHALRSSGILAQEHDDTRDPETDGSYERNSANLRISEQEWCPQHLQEVQLAEQESSRGAQEQSRVEEEQARDDRRIKLHAEFASLAANSSKGGETSRFEEETLDEDSVIFHRFFTAKWDETVEPDFTVPQLVGLALLAQRDRRGQENGVIDWIVETFPWYKTQDQSGLIRYDVQKFLAEICKTYDVSDSNNQAFEVVGIDQGMLAPVVLWPFEEGKASIGCRIFSLRVGHENFLFEELYRQKLLRTSPRSGEALLDMPPELWSKSFEYLHLPRPLHVSGIMEWIRIFIEKPLVEANEVREYVDTFDSYEDEGSWELEDPMHGKVLTALLPDLHDMLPLVGDRRWDEYVVEGFFTGNTFIAHDMFKSCHGYEDKLVALEFLKGIGWARKSLRHFQFDMTFSPEQKRHMDETVLLLGQSMRLQELAVWIDLLAMPSDCWKDFWTIPGMKNLVCYRGLSVVLFKFVGRDPKEATLRKFLDTQVIPTMKLKNVEGGVQQAAFQPEPIAESDLVKLDLGELRSMAEQYDGAPPTTSGKAAFAKFLHEKQMEARATSDKESRKEVSDKIATQHSPSASKSLFRSPYIHEEDDFFQG